jgi:hypothetical protein
VPGFFGAYGKKTGQGDWLAEGEGFEPSSLEPNGPTGIGEMHPVGNGPRSESRIPRRRTAKLQPAAINETPGRLINSRAATTQNAQKPIPTLGTKNPPRRSGRAWLDASISEILPNGPPIKRECRLSPLFRPSGGRSPSKSDQRLPRAGARRCRRWTADHLLFCLGAAQNG